MEEQVQLQSQLRSELTAQSLPQTAQQRLFYLEDTVDRCYRDVVEQLQRLGWKRTSAYKKRAKLERRRLPVRDVPDLVWALNEKDIDFADLGDEQFCNHFQGITELTTKRGFCNVLRDMPWSGENPLEVSPRCYNLGDPVHRDEFIDDFRLTAAVSILKWFVMLQLQASEKHSETLRSIQGVIDSCIYACTWKIRIDHHGEWPGVDRSRVFRDQEENFGLTGNQWSEILHKSYKLGERSEQWTGRALQECIFSFKSSNDLKLSLVISVLRHLAKSCPQFYLDGFRNVWVIKAAESSCGIGITLFYRLQDILGSEKGMGGRTVQKYLENPLVRYEIPSQLKVAVDSSTSNSHRGISQIEQSKKFDIRVWVLVLSFNPLVVKIFNKVYGRRCSSKFSLTTTSLSDCWMHLSNYAVQKKKATTNNSGNAAVRKSIIQNNNVVAVSEPKNNKPNTKIFRDISEQGEDYDDRGISEKTSASELASKNRVRRLRQLCTDSRSITEDSGQWQSSTATEDYISKDVDPSLLVVHEEILAAVNNRYESIRKVKRTSKECDAVEVQSCAWSSIVWPAIRRKILASLRATQAIVNHRSRSFQFLGYDVIIDEWCCPWLLEVNMSPAMARRSLEHSSMIATMSQGLVNLAVIGSSKSFQVDENGTSGKIDEDHWESLSGDDRLIEIRCEPAKPQQEPIPRSSRPKSAAGAAASRPGLSRPKSAGSTRRSLDSYKVIDTLSILSQNDKFDDDMKVVDRNIPTPRSISVITDISSRKISIDGLDEASLRQINLFVAGTTASDERMLFVDSMCNHFSACLLLQRWFTRYLARLRSYHCRRKLAATKIQSKIRTYIARLLLKKLIRDDRAVRIQSVARIVLAKRKVLKMRRHSRSIRIQCIVRRRLARVRLIYLRKLRSGSIIWHWYISKKRMYLLKRMRVLLKYMKLFLKRRRYLRLIVYRTLALNYRGRCCRAVLIQRIFRKWRVRKNLLTSLSKVRCKALSLAASEEARRRLRRLFGDDYYETESDNNYIYYDSIIIEGRKLPGLEFVNAQSSKSQETVAIESIDAVQIELDSIFEVIGDSAETKQYIKECVESDNYTRICSLENILNQKFTISSHQSPFTKMKERKSIFTVEDFINTHHAVDTDLANEVKTSELEDVFAHLNYPRPISTQQEEDEFPYSSPSISCPSAPVISPLTKAPKDALLPSVEETNKDSLENSSVSISVSITRKRSKTIKNKYDSDIFRKIVDADDVAASYDREVDFNDASKKNSVNSSEPPRYMKYAGNSSAIDPIRARDLPAFKSNRGDALSGDKKRPVSANGAVRSSSSANGSSNSGANWYHRLATRNDSKQVMKETKRKVRPSSAQKTRTWRLDSAIDDSGTEDCLSPSTNVMFYNHFGLSRDAKQSILSMFDQKEATRFAGESNRAALQETVDNISKLDHLTFDDIAVRKSNALLERYLYATKESSQFAKAPKTPHPLTISREELRAFAPEFDLHATSDVPASDGNAKARLKKKKKKSQKKMDAVRERIKSAYMG